MPKDLKPETEDVLMAIITNDASAPILIEDFNTLVVFKRPAFKDKYKARVWANRKLRESGMEDPDEDKEMSFFFRYWGALNTYITNLYYEKEDGTRVFNSKKYAEYTFDPKIDLDYSFLFEKYAIEEVYNKGLSEELFISQCIQKHNEWLGLASVEDSELKNS
jgi:hypothetical protein